MITGVRGSGKTVFLTELTDYFKREDWIVVDLIPDNNMISSLISHLANNKVLNKLFIKADISINAFGVNVGFNNEVPAANEEIILERMFKVLADNGKRLLIAIDEVVNNEYVQRFASLYQLWIRQNYPIFFLMTGLYENIY
jgi:RNase adaptor protein for sRNA GlmZ degradation